ncbi:MAG: hypothetical protein LBC63_01865 [Holophagales bacterium]|nr:hypothetical protein [Holophagales bacterium]
MRNRTISAAALIFAACLMAACHKGADKALQEKLEARLTNIEAKIQALTWRLQGTDGTEGAAQGADEADEVQSPPAAPNPQAPQGANVADAAAAKIEQRLAAIESMLNPSAGPYSNPASIADRLDALEKK